MSNLKARQQLINQLAYALNVQILVEKKQITDPEPLASRTQKQLLIQAAEKAIDEFERMSLISHINNLTRDHKYLYGVGQALIAAFVYSLVLALVAWVVRENGVDLLHALTPPGAAGR
jgi:hypothetical protein